MATEMYFAIGSMLNKVSLKARNLNPEKSIPAVLQGYRLIFDGIAGMGSIEPTQDPVEYCHGVIHWVTKEEVALLDQIESVYDKVICTAHSYNSSQPQPDSNTGKNGESSDVVTVECFAYRLKEPERGAAAQLPSQRYLDILSLGAESHGVNPEYVNKLRQHPCTPRRTPEQMRSFAQLCAETQAHAAKGTNPELSNIMLRDFVTFANAHDERRNLELAKEDPPTRLVMTIGMNGRVVEILGEKDVFARIQYLQKGKDLTVGVAAMIWEPNFGPPPRSLDEMSKEHRMYSEDTLLSFLKPRGFEFRIIGRLDYGQQQQKPQPPTGTQTASL